MPRWSQRERTLLAALVLSYAVVFPVHLLARAGLPTVDSSADAVAGGQVMQPSRLTLNPTPYTLHPEP